MEKEGKTLNEVTNEDIVNGTFIIPSSVTKIEMNAFSFCASLKNIIIPNSVTKIGDTAFYDCTSLKNIIIPNSVIEIGNSVFCNCTSLESITIPNSVTKIGDSVFWNCTSLESIAIPNSVTKIGDSAFSHCTSLKSITIPNSVEIIKSSAFSNCTSLESITIPDSVMGIGIGAFSNCTSLKSITIPNGVTEIGDYIFWNCTSLENIELLNSVTEIGDDAFNYCTSLKGITIPNSVTEIGYCAFSNCTSLKSITIPNSVVKIGSLAFNYCKSLERIEISSSLTEIEICAFRNCTSLRNVTIPNSIKMLSYSTFDRCSNLNLNILTSLFYFVGQSIDDFFDVKSITIYGQKMDKDNFKQELDNVRRKELLDKIIAHFINNNILDIKHYKYSLHKEFIESVVKKYSDSEEYYNYKDDFDKYMEEYINKKHLRKEIIDKEIDDILTIITETIKNYSIEELDTSSSINIINYGEELLKTLNKISDAISKIIDNYGPTNTLLEKELKKFRSPRNIAQYLDNVNEQEEKIYLGKNSINFLIYCNDYNSYRISLGIKKLHELQSILKLYEEKLNDYKNKLINYKSISINGNELHEMDDLLTQKQINKKTNNYTNQIILTNNVYNEVQNDINMYQIYMATLEKSRILLENIKRGQLINNGIINDEETVKSLNELLRFYENIDTKNGKKNSK